MSHQSAAPRQCDGDKHTNGTAHFYRDIIKINQTPTIMDKKKYIAPEITVVNMEAEALMAASGEDEIIGTKLYNEEADDYEYGL